MNQIRLTDIAQRENLSVTYLSHFIKDILSQTFQEYLNQRRFMRARELVTSKKLKLNPNNLFPLI